MTGKVFQLCQHVAHGGIIMDNGDNRRVRERDTRIGRSNPRIVPVGHVPQIKLEQSRHVHAHNATPSQVEYRDQARNRDRYGRVRVCALGAHRHHVGTSISKSNRTHQHRVLPR